MANISSCLRIVLAFSTPFSSANETSSAGSEPGLTGVELSLANGPALASTTITCQGDLERLIEAFIDYYKHQRDHENLGNLTLDVYSDRGDNILPSNDGSKHPAKALAPLQARRVSSTNQMRPKPPFHHAAICPKSFVRWTAKNLSRILYETYNFMPTRLKDQISIGGNVDCGHCV